MVDARGIGILGVGVYLPDEIRTNDWWPPAVRAKWREKAESFQPKAPPEGLVITDGVQAVAAAIAETRSDPLFGSVSRRVIAEGQTTSDMETRAAREAIARAGIDPATIDLVLGATVAPDYQCAPNPCAVHHNLGLRPDCQTVAIDNVCSSFIQQLTVSEALIRTGRAHVALLTQSCLGSAAARPESPQSTFLGDGATAVILGSVSEGRGILASAHRTDGSLRDGMVGGIPGKRWLDEGHFQWYVLNRDIAKRVILGIADCGREVVHAALAEAGYSPADVDYYACHQATPWFGRVTRDFIGLAKSRHLDTYRWTTSLSPANIPLQMATGEREGLLKPGDLVATYSGGSGITYGSVVLRWGR